MLSNLRFRTSLFLAASFVFASFAFGCDRSDVDELASAAKPESVRNTMTKPPVVGGKKRDCLEICRYECVDEVNRTGCMWICRCESPK